MFQLKILYIVWFLMLLVLPRSSMAQTRLCRDVVPDEGTASCMGTCGGAYPTPYPDGDAACRTNNSNKPKCCGKAEPIIPPTGNQGQTQETNQTVTQAETRALPTFSSLIKLERTTVIGNIIKSLLGLTGTVTVIMMVYGGLLWMTAAGNEKAVSKAKQIILWTAIGLVLIFSSYTILNFLFSSLRA